jgi:hypothetical protein
VTARCPDRLGKQTAAFVVTKRLLVHPGGTGDIAAAQTRRLGHDGLATLGSSARVASAARMSARPGGTWISTRARWACQGDLVEDHLSADAALVFVTSTEDLTAPDVEAVLDLARRDGLAWVAYPKAGRLGTDLNRDSLGSPTVGARSACGAADPG